jgi:hypothetical protein
MIDAFFYMEKDSILTSFDEEYVIVETGPEASYEGYYFKNTGLIFVFEYDDVLAEYNDTLAWIETTDPFKINGVREGMNLSQVQECLGEAEMFEDWWEVPDHTTYNIEYLIGKCKYRFTSFEPDGTEAWLTTIYWGKDRYSTKYVKQLFDMTKDEVIVKFGISYYFEYILGEYYELVETGINGYEGYYFKKHGLTFAFEQDNSVAFIITNEKIEINKSGAGMCFSQIKDCWGNREVIETYLDNKENIAYKIEYLIDGCKYEFLSFQPDGSGSILRITRVG